MKNMKRSLAFLFVFVLMLAAFTACQQPQEEHTHVFADATCTAPKTCECGATEGKALGHTYVDGKCACGAKDPNYVAHYHSYESVVTAPTCTEKGYTTYTCACGDSYTAHEVAANGHSHNAVVTAPTCTEDGYTTYTCACGDTYTADVVTANGHSHNAVVTAPTCTEDGYTTYTCACGDTYTADEVPAKHNTNEDGICSACGTQFSVVPQVGKAYIFGMYQGNLNKVYYLKGGMSGYYMATTTNPDAALCVSLEETEGGYYMYCYVGGVKTYINMVVSGTHVNGAYQATASTVYTIDEANKTVIAKVNGSDYWFGTRNDKTYDTVGPCAVSYKGFFCEFYYSHTHDFVATGTTAPSCTKDGYTTYACDCGASYKADLTPSNGHTPGEWEIETNATCTEDGKKIIKCTVDGCGAVISSEVIPAAGHTYVDGKCSCGAEDPNYSAHEHNYDAVVTAPTCTAAGYTTYTCACGDTYTGDETPIADHIDTNLDITCDFEGCTKRILPPADSKVSLFTANHMIIVSLSSSYYVEGTITEITDAKNGIFIIADDAGYSLLVRLPKNAEGLAYSSWTDRKVVVGDKVQVYGKPAKNSSAPTTEKAKVEGGILTILEHTHNFSEATCTTESICACLTVNAPALGHIDEDGNNLCDRCPWNMKFAVSSIAVSTDSTSNGVVDDAKTFWTWGNDEFDVVIAKGTSTVTLYTTAKPYMQLKKQNTLTVVNKDNATISTVTIGTTNATQFTNLKNALTADGKTYTEDSDAFTVTIEWNSTEDFLFTNKSTTTAYISSVTIVYEK